MSASSKLFAREHEPFTEIEFGGEFLDGLLTREDFISVRCSVEPGGECVFAGTGARSAEQLKEAGGTEDIEVACVGMREIEEALASFSRSCPTILDAADTALVVGPQPGAV